MRFRVLAYAPKFRPAMRFAAPVRASLGVATIFNFLGPLREDPGRIRRQVVGVSDATMAEKMLGVLESSTAPCTRWCCTVNDGLDELSTVTRSRVHATLLADDGSRQRTSFEVDPAELGLAYRRRPRISAGGDASHNAAAAAGHLSGKPRHSVTSSPSIPRRAGLVIARKAPDLVAEASPLAQSILSDGSALRVVDRYVAATNDAPEN